MRLWLKQLREQAGFKQEAVASLLGVTQTAYSKLENGERRKDLPLSIMSKLSDIFSISLEQICEWENNNDATHV